MPERVYNNIEGHRVIDKIGSKKYTIEDVTKIGLPTFKHPVSEMKNISGMAMDVSMPNTTHLEAADLTLYHNNGLNSKYLAVPEKHMFEIRTVRQRLDVASGVMDHESVKYRITCVHTETQGGDLETGSPYGSTEKYSIMRYEEEVNGTVIKVFDVTGTIKYNGKSYTDPVAKMLN